MKPRIFISSTFYDLKYIREDLANFVRSYGYEPVLFEDGDIGYTPGKTIDTSCYESMRNSDMVILIIGGEYGSPASGETKDEFKEYISVTRNEFRAAVDSGIPIFVMIDKNVIVEYGVYEVNYDDIEKENRPMTFPTTKNINVFRFIKEIKGIVTLPIQEFEKSSDIKGFISKQWADMFKNYLGSLRKEPENKKIETSVKEMETLIQKMDIMLDRIGKNILSKDNFKEYQNVINLQDVIEFCNVIINTFYLEIDNVLDDVLLEKNNSEIRKKIIVNFLNKIKEVGEKDMWPTFETMDNDYNKNNDFFYIFSEAKIRITSIHPGHIQKLREKYKILYNLENFEEIANALITDKYFYDLFNILGNKI